MIKTIIDLLPKQKPNVPKRKMQYIRAKTGKYTLLCSLPHGCMLPEAGCTCPATYCPLQSLKLAMDWNLKERAGRSVVAAMCCAFERGYTYGLDDGYEYILSSGTCGYESAQKAGVSGDHPSQAGAASQEPGRTARERAFHFMEKFNRFVEQQTE